MNTMSRRSFVAAGLAGWLSSRPGLSQSMPVARPAVAGGGHYFFGYYDKCPWDVTGRYLLAHAADFHGRQPKPGETVQVGVADQAAGGLFRPVARTAAWSWQQGAMLRWLPDGADRRLIYNTRQGDAWGAEMLDLFSGKRTALPFPIYNVNHDGSLAMSLNFSRLAWTRPGYGYEGIRDAGRHITAPVDDGLYRVDLRGGTVKLVISLADLVRHRPRPVFGESFHWVNHLLFNQDGSRFAFLHRWQRPGKGWWTRLFTAAPDGTGLRLLLDHGMVSHFIWENPGTLLAWARREGGGDHFYRINDGTGEAGPVGQGILTEDGHCSFSPDGQWILTDTYPDRQRNMRRLMLYRERDKKKVVVGRFHSPPGLRGPCRCDLHPRWNRAGTKICIDSAHDNKRQMYILDVSDYTG